MRLSVCSFSDRLKPSECRTSLGSRVFALFSFLVKSKRPTNAPYSSWYKDKAYPVAKPKKKIPKIIQSKNPHIKECDILLVSHGVSAHFSAATASSAFFLERSYFKEVSPLNMVPNSLSQMVKKGWEKLDLIPQLWWWMSW